MLINKMHAFSTPGRLITGIGCIKEIGMLSKGFGKRALLVTDENLFKVGTVTDIINYLKKANIDVSIYCHVNGEPNTNHVHEGSEIFKQDKCQFLIAVGGGSPIDAAKAIGIVCKYNYPIKNFMGHNKVPGPSVDLIAIPTTAGSGSEATKAAIITDVEEKVKMLILSHYLIPALAICDAELTITAPKTITASTGLDAFTHAIEAYTSIKSQPITDILAVESIRLISKYLRQAWSNGTDLEARYHIMTASTQAGLAFSNSSVALVHGMSRPIGVCFNVPHGISNAVILPTVMRFSVPGNIEKYACIARAMGEQVKGLSLVEAAEKAVSASERLCRDLDMLGLRNIGISKDELKRFAPKMARDAIDSGSPENNPRKANHEEIVQLYMDAY